MLKNLRKIKKERNACWESFAIYYTGTAIDEANKWRLRLHDPKPMYGNQLSLIRRYARSGRITRFEFAVHDKTGDGKFILNDKKVLHVYYDHCFGTVHATLYYDKDIYEIRKEKLSDLLRPDAFEPIDNTLRIEHITFDVITLNQ